MTKTNIATITINELVTYTNYSEFQSTLQANIKGPNAPYTFKYAIYDPNNITSQAENFTQFRVQIYEVEASLYGGGLEKVELWFQDLSVVKDIAGNNFSEGKFSGNLKFTEYISTGKTIFY
jgi:hypothetical protein